MVLHTSCYDGQGTRGNEGELNISGYNELGIVFYNLGYNGRESCGNEGLLQTSS